MKHFLKIFVFIVITTTTSVLNPYEISLSSHIIDVEPNVSETASQNNGDIILPGTAVNIVYYNQKDDRWGNKIYGSDNIISIYGCGPTALAMLVSSLTDEKIQPDKMASWAYDNGYFCENSGSYHSIISEAPAKWGLNVTPVLDYSKENLIELLSTGNLIVVLMGNGHFTENGHFIILRGVSLEGKFLIADPANLDNSENKWDPQIIIDEAKYGCGNSGPMWAISTY